MYRPVGNRYCEIYFCARYAKYVAHTCQVRAAESYKIRKVQLKKKQTRILTIHVKKKIRNAPSQIDAERSTVSL